LVLGESHLRRILTRYFSYYHRARTHLALDKDAPDLRPVELPEAGRIVEIPEVGALHPRYLRQAASSSTGCPHYHRTRVPGPAPPPSPPAPVLHRNSGVTVCKADGLTMPVALPPTRLGVLACGRIDGSRRC